MRQMLAVVLAIVLSGNLVAQSAPPKSVKEQVMALPIGTLLDVHLTGGGRVSGQLVSTDPNGFTLRASRTKTSRVIFFAEAERIKVHKATHTPVVAWVVAGAVVAVVVIVIAAFAIERHNE